MSAPDVALIAAALSSAGLGDTTLHAFDSLGSTNGWLQRGDGAGVESRAVCATDHQPSGSGRRGRGWHSGPGNLTFSLLDRLAVPLANGGLVSLVTGVAAARALRTACNLPVTLKWPNDLWLGDSKLGGLLHEARHDGGENGPAGLRVVAGIGINVCDEPHLQALGATSLQAHGIDTARRDELLAAIAIDVFGAWACFEAEGWAQVAADWDRFDALRDREVGVYESMSPRGAVAPDWTGVARGVDASGALLVDTGQGRRAVHAGDVSVRVAGGRAA